MSRGEAACWLALALFGTGALFPGLFARDFLDSRQIVRLISVPVALVAAFALLNDYILHIV